MRIHIDYPDLSVIQRAIDDLKTGRHKYTCNALESHSGWIEPNEYVRQFRLFCWREFKGEPYFWGRKRRYLDVRVKMLEAFYVACGGVF